MHDITHIRKFPDALHTEDACVLSINEKYDSEQAMQRTNLRHRVKCITSI